MHGHGYFASTSGRQIDDGDSPGRTRLRLGSVPPSVKLMDTKPVYVVMHSDREYGTAAKPAVYDPYYGVNYVPSNGRDSWSAYHISDAALDDNDELVLKSRERDSLFLKDINRKLVSALHGTPPSPRQHAASRATEAAAAAPTPRPPRAPASLQRQLPARPRPSPATAEGFLVSQQPEPSSRPKLSPVRAHIRDVLERSRQK